MVSENLEISESNTSLDSIFSAFSQVYPGSKENVTESLLTKIIVRVFPNVKKSSVRVTESLTSEVKKKPSFKGLSINSKKLYGAELPFVSLKDMIPSNWFVVSQTDKTAVFGKVSDERFNSNPVLQRIQIESNGDCLLYVGDQRVDMEDYYIYPRLKFYAWSIASFFRCIDNALRLCCGHEKMSRTFDSSLVGVTESFTHCILPFKKSVIRHIYCDRIVPIQATVQSCKKCSSLFYRTSSNIDQANVDGTGIDQREIRSILHIAVPNIGEKQLLLIETQLKAASTSKYGMRWPKELISMALSIFNRNPSSYRILSQNGWLHLPSERLLTVYKNAVSQKPGVNPDMMQWMQQEANRQNVPSHGMYGGIIMDEMSIQEDLAIVSCNKGQQLVGFSDSGKDCFLMNAVDKGQFERKLANHVLQYFFNGLSGFRWPFANYPNTQAPPAELFVTAWKCIEALEEYGFHPIYCCMDGSSNNRAFLKMHFPSNDLLSKKMIANHYKNPRRQIIFMMDPCHLLKKIRNSILSSGHKDFHTRVLSINGRVVLWQMWIDAYLWDRNNPFPIHRKLSDEHIFPNNAQKMRNKLAFDVLDKDMLHLMQTYNESLTNGSEDIKAAMSLLENTSFLVEFFADSRPIKDMSDARLKQLTDVYNWFKAWEKFEAGDEPSNKRYKSLLTMETREDIDFLYHGFMSLVQFSLTELKHGIVPSRINSDIIENVFCQQRSLYHGATTNPTYNAYRTGINSVILGQATISKKSNAGDLKAEPFASSLKLPRLQ